MEHELRRVMSRTERLSSTPDRDGMLVERPLDRGRTRRADLRVWRTFDDVARRIDRHDVFEYWRSTPYPLNLMERNSYQVRTKFQAAVERNDPRRRRDVWRSPKDSWTGTTSGPTDMLTRGTPRCGVWTTTSSIEAHGDWPGCRPSLPYYEPGRRLRRASAPVLHQAPGLLGLGRRAQGDRGDAELRGGASSRGGRRIRRPRIRRPSHHTALAVPDDRRPGRGHAGPCAALPLARSRSGGRSTRGREEPRAENCRSAAIRCSTSVRDTVRDLLSGLPEGSCGSVRQINAGTGRRRSCSIEDWQTRTTSRSAQDAHVWHDQMGRIRSPASERTFGGRGRRGARPRSAARRSR